MVISPNDFSLWARLTGNKYPSTPRERAQKGPEVQRFIQNLDKEGMLGGKQEEQKKKEKGLPEKLATGALIAGGIAAGVAAARDPRVQNVARRAGSATKDKIKDFLVNFSEPRDVDIDIINASNDVTPNPREQQSNIGSQTINTNIPKDVIEKGIRIYDPNLPGDSDQFNAILPVGSKPQPEQKVIFDPTERFTPAVEGKTFGTSGAVSKLEDIGDAKLRARRTYGPMIDAIQQKNPGINVGGMGRSMLAKAEQDRDYDIAYMVARGQGKTDETATQIARATAGFPTDSPVGKPTPYREFLGEQRTSSIRKESIDNLLNLVETGPQIILPEKAQKINDGSSAIVLAGGGNNTNVIPTMGATIGGSSLTDKHATKMAVDNALDNVRATLKNNRIKAEELMGPRPKFPIDDPARQEEYKKLSIDNPLQYERELDESIKADMAYTDELSYIEDVLNEQAGVLAQKRAKTLIGPFQAAPITGVTSTGLKTSIQDDNLRRIAPTPEQAQAIREEPGRVSRTFDEMTGFTAPKSETISTNPLEERISRLEGKTAELRAVQENLSRAGELMSAGLDPRTTRFDSARAAGLTSKSGIKPRITNPRFQENVNLGKVQEAAIPESSGRVFFEQDSEGRVIPETVERRSEYKVVRGPDTKTITSGGGYQPRGGVGSSIGAYGIEPTDFAQADITKRPTDTGSKQSFSKRPPSANPVESFDVANQLRKIQTDQSISPEERRARSKDFLKQKMSERGISAMGESEPLRKR